MCPNINNKQVREQFNSIIEAFGGAPMTELEFREPDVRNARLGVDYDAMQAAYLVWDKNNGNPIHMTPDGNRSELYDYLISNLGELAAIKAKVAIYTDTWYSLFGSYEPNVETYRKVMLWTDEMYSPYNESQAVEFSDAFTLLFENPYVENQVMYNDSTTVLQRILDRGLLPESLQGLASILLSGENVRIQASNALPAGKSAKYDPNTKSILFSVDVLKRWNSDWTSMIVLHELMHHYLTGFLVNPQTKTEIKLSKLVNKLFNHYRSLFTPDEINSQRKLYGLRNKYEFVAELMSNPYFNDAIRERIKSSKAPMTLWSQIKNIMNDVINAIAEFFGVPVPTISSALTQLENYVRYSTVNGTRSFSEAALFNNANSSEIELNALVINNLRPYETDVQLQQRMNKMESLFNDIKAGLYSRINNLKKNSARSSQINESKNVLRDMQTLGAQEGIVKFLSHAEDVLLKENNFKDVSLDKLTTQRLVAFKTDVLGFYKPLLERSLAIMEATTLFNNYPLKADLLLMTELMLSFVQQLNARFDEAVSNRAQEIIQSYSDIAMAPQWVTDDILNNINVTDLDLMYISLWAGMARETGRSPLIRLVDNVLRNSVNRTKRNSLDRGNKLKELWNTARKKYGTSSMKTFLELDKNGIPTGNFVRDLNYGLELLELEAFLKQVAKDLGFKEVSPDEYEFPDINTLDGIDKIYQYNKRMNEWLGQHVERKYTTEYYNMMNQLTPQSREALNDANYEISKIIDSITDDEGEVRWEKITKSQFARYNERLRDKARLESEFDSDGVAKTGTDLAIAHNISDVNETIRKNTNYKVNKRKFLETVERKKKELTDSLFKTWYYVNTVESFSDADQAFLDNMEKMDYHPEYKAVYEKRRKILRTVKHNNKNYSDGTIVNGKLKAVIKELDARLDRLRELNPKRVIEEGEETFNDRFATIRTPEFEAERKLAIAEKRYQQWEDENFYADSHGNLHPISIWNRIVPRDELGLAAPEMMELQPSQMWSELDENSQWANKNFDRSSDEYIQPKRSLYDNTKAYKAIADKPEMKALYDEMIRTMELSYNKISFLTNHKPYQLPQISARTMVALTRKGSLLKNLGWVIEDAWIVKDDDTEFVPEFDQSPSGEYLKHIPTRYLNRLDNPKYITSDVVGSVVSFFEMAENYKNMEEIKDPLSTIMLKLEGKEVRKGSAIQRQGKQLREYLFLENYLDMNMYGKQKLMLKTTYIDPFTGKKKVINWSKGLGQLANAVRGKNLIWNVYSSITNSFTAEANVAFESFAGRYFDNATWRKAKGEYMQNLIQLGANVGNSGHVNKLLALCEYNEVAMSNEEVFSKLDLTSPVRALSNHWSFGSYSVGDFAAKSTVMAATYFSYKLVTNPDGTKQFMHKLDFISNYNGTKKDALTYWNSLTETLYDAYDVDNTNTPRVKPEYKKYVTEALENRFKNMNQQLCAKVDMQTSSLDKSKIHQNGISNLFAIHRNWMIIGVHDRFKKKQYNYMTGITEQGLYPAAGNSVMKFGKGLVQNMKETGNILKSFEDARQELTSLEKYAVNRVLIDATAISALAFLIVPMLCEAADEDRDDFALNFWAYIAMRTQLELASMYKPSEFLELVNSPAAGISFIDSMYEGITMFFNPSNMTKEVNRGAYEGWLRWQRNLIKLTPAKNLFEAGFPQEKRQYFQNKFYAE